MEDYAVRNNLVPPARLRELTVRSDRAGAWQAASHFGAIGITATALLHTWGSLWALPVFVLHGMLINFLFAAQHECNHYTAFRTRWVNDVINRITGFILFYPRSYERWLHFEHHRHTQDWQRDPELMDRAPYAMTDYLLYLLGISYWLGLLRRMFCNALGRSDGDYFTAAQRRHITHEARWHLAGYAAIAALSTLMQSWLAVTLWVAPMLCTKILHQVQNITEHTGACHMADTLYNTRTIRTWWWLRWMGWNMQYHTAHHTYPAVPFHRLPELHAEIVARAGHPLPTIGYIDFQRRFLRVLACQREPVTGLVGALQDRPRCASTP